MDNRGEQDLVTLNLRGRKFLTHKALFELLPESKLSKLMHSKPTENEFYFDTNPVLFDNILDVYKTGEFHIPAGVCGTIILNELDYWCIPKYYIAKCCMKAYSCYLEELKIMKEIAYSLKKECVVEKPCSSKKDINHVNVSSKLATKHSAIVTKHETGNHDFRKCSTCEKNGLTNTSSNNIHKNDEIENTNHNFEDNGCLQNQNNAHAVRELGNESKRLHSDIIMCGCESMTKYSRDGNHRKWMFHLYRSLEDPFSSKPALIWGCFFLLLVITSVAIQCLSTHPKFRTPVQDMSLTILQNSNNNLSSIAEVNDSVQTASLSPFPNYDEDNSSPLRNNTLILNNSQYGNGIAESFSTHDPMTLDKLLITTSSIHLKENSENITVNRKSVTESLVNMSNVKINLYLTSIRHPVLTILQYICLMTFTIELFIRFAVCPNKKCFIFNLFNIIDLLALVPTTAIELMVYFRGIRTMVTDDNLFNLTFYLSAMGVFKTLRLVKFFRHYNAMKVLLLALRASLQEILLLLLLISIGMLIFSTLIYHTEFYTEDFETIPIGFWWSIVTMTTVGYGDTHPITPWGYLVGALCALAGMLSTGLPIPIIANNFNLYYTYAKVYTCDVALQSGKRRKKIDSSPQLAYKNSALSVDESIGNHDFQIKSVYT